MVVSFRDLKGRFSTLGEQNERRFALRSRPLYDVMLMNKLSAATIRGRLLFLRARSMCGYYSRAAIIRGAATIRVNTVVVFGDRQ